MIAAAPCASSQRASSTVVADATTIEPHDFTRATTTDWGREVNGAAPTVAFSPVHNGKPWQPAEPLVGVASRLGLRYLDTGAMYRAMTWWMLENGIDTEDAQAVARVVEEAFQGRSELDDELLHKDVRQVFYDLQNEKILEVRREEVRVDGVDRRQYLWRVRDEIPLDVSPVPAPDPAERLYHRLDDEAWERRRSPQ